MDTNDSNFSNLISEKIDYYLRPEVSNSDIGNYIYGGIQYYKSKKDKKSKTEETYYELGEAFHCLILEPEVFSTRFCVSENKVSGLMGAFINNVRMLELNSPDAKAEDTYKLAYELTGWSLPYGRVINDFEKPNIKAAYEEVKANLGKIILSKAQLESINLMKDSLYKNNSALKFLNPGSHVKTILNELEIYWQASVVQKDALFDDIYTVDSKSKLDRVILDDVNKIAYIVDFKTTSKPIKQFPYYYKRYGYYRQMAYYRDALEWWLKDSKNGIDYSEYKIEVIIITVGTLWPYGSKVFTVSNFDLENGTREYKQALKELSWHIDNKVWFDKSSIDGTIETLQVTTTDKKDGRYEDERVETSEEAG